MEGTGPAFAEGRMQGAVGRMEMGSRSKGLPAIHLLATSQELGTSVRPQSNLKELKLSNSLMSMEQVCAWNFQKGCGPTDTWVVALSNQRTELSHAALISDLRNCEILKACHFNYQPMRGGLSPQSRWWML